MRILVTGATGFVGGAVLRALSPTHQILATGRSLRAVGRARVRWVACNLLEDHAAEGLIDDTRPEVVVHTAWHTNPRSYWHGPENADWEAATERLLDAFIARGGRRFIGVGSCAEYEPSRAVCHEIETPLAEETAYGRAKIAVCRRLEAECAAGRVEGVHARLFFLYGPGERADRLVPYLIERLLRGEPADTGPGQWIRDYLHVEDAGRALARLAEGSVLGAINLASGRGTSIAAIATRIADLAGRRDLLRIGARAVDGNRHERIVADVGRQTRELGFRPRISLANGLAALFSTSSPTAQATSPDSLASHGGPP